MGWEGGRNGDGGGGGARRRRPMPAAGRPPRYSGGGGRGEVDPPPPLVGESRQPDRDPPPNHSPSTSAASRPRPSSRSRWQADHAARSACRPADARNVAVGDGLPSITASAAATMPDAERSALPRHRRPGGGETGSRRRSSRGGSRVVFRDAGRSGGEERWPTAVASASPATASHARSDATASTSGLVSASPTPPPRTSLWRGE